MQSSIIVCVMALLLNVNVVCARGDSIESSSKADSYYRDGIRAAKQSHYQVAISAFSNSLDVENRSETYVARAAMWIRCSDFGKAIADCNSAIVLDEKSVMAYVYRALAKDQSGKLSMAIEDVTHAIEIDQQSLDALTIRARLLNKAGKHSLAMADLDRAIQIAPGQYSLHLVRATCHCENNEPNKAVTDGDRLVELCPNNADSYAIRGNIRQQVFDYYGAFEDFQTALSIDPNHALAMKSLASLIVEDSGSFQSRDHQKALILAQRACEQKRDSKELWKYLNVLASAYAINGNFETAAECQRESMQLTPEEYRISSKKTLDAYEAASKNSGRR